MLAGEGCKQHIDWMCTWLHPDLAACLPGAEATDSSWDMQADLEEAMINGTDLVASLFDYIIFSIILNKDGVRDC